MNALPPGTAKQEPSKASHVGAPLKQRLDRERDWHQKWQDGAEVRVSPKGRWKQGLKEFQGPEGGNNRSSSSVWP